MIKISKLVVALAVASVALAGCASRSHSASKEEQTLGVNRFLWSAALETVNFMPLSEADPYGGVILTDWYSNPASPNERFKATVYILDSRLRADGLKVAVFREIKNDAGAWQSAKVDADTGIQIENAILARARELKVNSLH